MGRHLNILLDHEIEAQLDAYCEREGVTRSAVVRSALRAYLKTGSSAYQSGWLEGLEAGKAEVLKAVRLAVAGLSVPE